MVINLFAVRVFLPELNEGKETVVLLGSVDKATVQANVMNINHVIEIHQKPRHAGEGIVYLVHCLTEDSFSARFREDNNTVYVEGKYVTVNGGNSKFWTVFVPGKNLQEIDDHAFVPQYNATGHPQIGVKGVLTYFRNKPTMVFYSSKIVNVTDCNSTDNFIFAKDHNRVIPIWLEDNFMKFKDCGNDDKGMPVVSLESLIDIPAPVLRDVVPLVQDGKTQFIAMKRPLEYNGVSYQVFCHKYLAGFINNN